MAQEYVKANMAYIERSRAAAAAAAAATTTTAAIAPAKEATATATKAAAATGPGFDAGPVDEDSVMTVAKDTLTTEENNTVKLENGVIPMSTEADSASV